MKPQMEHALQGGGTHREPLARGSQRRLSPKNEVETLTCYYKLLFNLEPDIYFRSRLACGLSSCVNQLQDLPGEFQMAS